MLPGQGMSTMIESSHGFRDWEEALSKGLTPHDNPVEVIVDVSPGVAFDPGAQSAKCYFTGMELRFGKWIFATDSLVLVNSKPERVVYICR